METQTEQEQYKEFKEGMNRCARRINKRLTPSEFIPEIEVLKE